MAVESTRYRAVGHLVSGEKLDLNLVVQDPNQGDAALFTTSPLIVVEPYESQARLTIPTRSISYVEWVESDEVPAPADQK